MSSARYGSSSSKSVDSPVGSGPSVSKRPKSVIRSLMYVSSGLAATSASSLLVVTGSGDITR